MESIPAARPTLTETRICILMVEDDFMTRWNVADFLRERGHRVIEAVDASDALGTFGSGTHVDIVFSDVHMPGAMDGHGLAEWLVKNHPRVPMLLTSGIGAESSKVAASDTRCFVDKPYDLSDIESRLVSMVLSRTARGCE
ncbi:MAG: response regulator [Gammaproteobacteria bacterium]|nr:response regulator [Gammaproteobacteria bacterium]